LQVVREKRPLRIFFIFLERAAQKVLSSINKSSIEKARSRKRPMAIWIGVSVAVIVFGLWFFIRTYVVASYSIPTSAMEKTVRTFEKEQIR